MSRKVFFSFHYKRDAWRAGQVRNSNLIAKEDKYGYVDAAEWEQIEKQGRVAIEHWIAEQMKFTSVTVVLIGAETAQRPWVKHEIKESWERGNGLLGVFIHNIKNQEQKTDIPGDNPFASIHLKDGTPLTDFCKTYDWVNDDGRTNIGKWIENAYQDAQSYKGERGLKESERVNIPGPFISKDTQIPGGFTPRSPWSRLY